jgi:Gamma tubulin complex component C-terminal
VQCAVQCLVQCSAACTQLASDVRFAFGATTRQWSRGSKQANRAATTTQVEVERSLARLAGETCAPRMGALLRACLRLRSEMAHLVGNLQTYVNTEVLECEWLLLLLLLLLLLRTRGC